MLRQRDDVEVTALVTTVNEHFDRVAMHAVRRELLEDQARAAGLKLRVVSIPHPCSNAEYEAAFHRSGDDAMREGVELMAFGDIFLEDVRSYRENLFRIMASCPKTQTNSRPVRRGVSDERCLGLVGNGS